MDEVGEEPNGIPVFRDKTSMTCLASSQTLDATAASGVGRKDGCCEGSRSSAREGSVH